uniref:Uncharacterized protein n=1 Tax=Micrurus lemniscatus lemniscatus TaxID=129467 RepID=A0A2D4JBZ6_MICLE
MYSNENAYCIGNKPNHVCQGTILHHLCWQRFGKMGQGRKSKGWSTIGVSNSRPAGRIGCLDLARKAALETVKDWSAVPLPVKTEFVRAAHVVAKQTTRKRGI